ncbi:MAG: tape measure protein [Patescibacteria group bacterium]
MAETTLSIVINAVNNAQKAFNDASAGLEKIQKNLKPATDASKKFALGLGVVATALSTFGILSLKSAGNMEQTKIAFETMLGSADKAKKLYSDLVAFAAKTPFTLTGLETASKQLLAYGFTQEELLPNLKALGDIASGVGMDKLPNLILAFGQVRAATKLTGMELRQFTEAGVPLLGMLAEQMGEPVSRIQEMVHDGLIGFPAVEQALKSLSGEGGRFNNLMEKQSKSLGGMWSNLQDAWEQFLRGQGAKLLEWGKKLVEMITDIVQNSLPQWIAGIENVIKFFQEHKVAIYIVAGAIIGALVPAIISVAIAFGIAAIALAPWLIGGAIIGALVAGIVWIVQNWELIKSKVVEIWNAIAGFLSGIWGTITGAITTAWNAIGSFFNEIWEVIKNIFNFAITFITGLVIVIFKAMGIDIVAVFEGIKLFFQNVWNEIMIIFNTVISTIQNIWNTVWTAIKNFIMPIWDGIKNSIQAAWKWIVNEFKEKTKPIAEAWETLWKGLGDTVSMVWETVKNTIKSSINWILEGINKVINAINSVAKVGGKALGIEAVQIPNIPLLASGGIVSRPTLAMIGEAGPEAVVPLSRGFAGAGAGGITININGGTYLSEEAALDIANTVANVLKLQLRT